MKFKCVNCNEFHNLDDISFGWDSPVQWSLLSDSERNDSVLGNDHCEIFANNEYSFYIRGCLEIPITNKEGFYTWGVWCSLSEKSYSEVLHYWDNPNRMDIGPHFGWLCTKIPDYLDTVFMKSMVYQRELGKRPFVKLEQTDHPLSVHQYHGIRQDDLILRLSKYVHAEPGL